MEEKTGLRRVSEAGCDEGMGMPQVYVVRASHLTRPRSADTGYLGPSDHMSGTGRASSALLPFVDKIGSDVSSRVTQQYASVLLELPR